MNDFWLRAAKDIGSFRQMYALANEIADSSHSCPESRRAARRVTWELAPIIDQAIAPAEKLAKARFCFDELKHCLLNAA